MRQALAIVALVAASCTINAPAAEEPLQLPDDVALPQDVVRVSGQCNNGEVAQWDATSDGWVCGSVAPPVGGDISGVTAGAGLAGGAATGEATLRLRDCTTSGAVLKWNGSDWICGVDDAPDEAAIDGFVADNGYLTNESDPTVNELGNADLSLCSIGQIPKFNGTLWACDADLTGGGSDPWSSVAGGIAYSSGNVGIGTTAPGAKVTIAVPDDSIAPGISLRQDNNLNTGWDVKVDTAVDGKMYLVGLNPTETNVMTFDRQNGFVGVGTTSPDAGLVVNGDGSIWSKSFLFIKDAGDGDAGLRIYSGGGPKHHIFDDAPAHALRIAPEGNFGVGGITITQTGLVGVGTNVPGNILTVAQSSTTDPIADAWTTYSSRRWKKNIAPITDALAKVQQLRGVTYDWKADGKHDVGFIAEEVGKVLPEIVVFEENGTDAKSLDYARITAVLVEATKEQQKQIDSLDGENRQLKSRLARLEQAMQTLLAATVTKGTVQTAERR